MDGYNSFLCMSLDEFKGSKNSAIERLYKLGRDSVSRKKQTINMAQEEITIPVVVTAADGNTIETYNIILTRKCH